MTTGSEVVIRQPGGEVFVLPEPETLRFQLKKIKEFQAIVHELLDEGQDFGVIPGTDKPTLLKPGAEKINKILGLADQYEIIDQVEDWNKPFFRYMVRCKLVSMSSGVMVSSGMGECNSYESKYRYRNSQRKCPNCGAEAIIPGKKEWGGGFICWKKKGGCEAKFEDGDKRITDQVVGKVENEEVHSLVNTILKMAKKRGQIDMTLTATAASDVFDQDLEDLPDGMVPEGEKKATVSGTVKKKESPKAEGKEKTVNDTLADELAAYCPDEAMRPALLKQITAFKDKEGNQKWAADITSMSNKWAGTALGKLRELAKKKGGGWDAANIPANCPKNPRECEHSGWVNGIPGCGPEGAPCQFGEVKG